MISPGGRRQKIIVATASGKRKTKSVTLRGYPLKITSSFKTEDFQEVRKDNNKAIRHKYSIIIEMIAISFNANDLTSVRIPEEVSVDSEA